MIKIAIGTTSRYKINAIRKTLHEVDFEFESNSVDVDSGISEQPLNLGETKQGSINRAKAAISKVNDCDFGLGVEFGYEPINESFHMICWASIATKNGEIFSEHSSSLQLPKKLHHALLDGKDISDNLIEITTKLEDTERNRIFIQYLKKRKFIYESVLAVIIRYLLDKEAY